MLERARSEIGTFADGVQKLVHRCINFRGGFLVGLKSLDGCVPASRLDGHPDIPRCDCGDIPVR